MKNPSDSEWDEFHDLEVVDWKRVRAVIEHENILVNHRLTWFFSSQAFLFGAFALLFNEEMKSSEPENTYLFQIMLGSMASIGSALCLFLFHSMRSAQNHLDLVDNWYHGEANPVRLKREPVKNYPERQDAKDFREKRNPPLQGEPSRDWTYYFKVKYIPILFLLAWIVLLLLVVFDVFGNHKDFIDQHGLTLVLLAVVAMVSLLIGRYTAKKNLV